MAERTSRDQILAAIRAGKPQPMPLPDRIGFPSFIPENETVDTYIRIAESNGGRVIRVGEVSEIPTLLAQDYDLSLPTLSYVPDLPLGNFAPTENLRDLDTLNLTVLAGQVGVAENAAIWLNEARLGIRTLAFITLNLAIVLHEKDLVSTMHDAYNRVDLDTGFGVFIAGPSKTADIEQSLVIGAHGAKTLTVFLVKD